MKYLNKIINFNCLTIMKDMPENSVDSIVTDPPYGLVSIVKRFGGKNSRNTPAMETKEGGVFARKAKGFMGKEWDGSGIENNVNMWKECLRVLKPGGHLLSFGGTRTYHRMAVAIEDAGFEVRDMIEWVYGSGFPKSLNIGKAVDKLQGNEREYLSGTPKPIEYSGKFDQRSSEERTKTKGTSEWEGWGTALKPAREDWLLMRKPLSEKTVAENCLKWGTGGIAIDASRVAHNEPVKETIRTAQRTGTSLEMNTGKSDKWVEGTMASADPSGRFPANLIHDNSEEVRECFPETKSPKTYTRKSEGFNQNSYGKGMGEETGKESLNFGDSGNASRFFRAIPQVVDYNDFLIYNRNILTNIKQLCGQHLTKKKTDIILDGVIKEAEKFIQDAELLIFGNSTMEKFLTDTASTIKTLTQQMTELKTLNVLPSWLIMKFTEDYEKTIKLLKELNTEDVKNAESINHLIVFKREMLELIRDIARNVVIKNSENGKLRTENESMLTPENINGNTSDNSRFFKSIVYQAKPSKKERNAGCEGLEDNFITEQNKWTENDYRKGDGEKTVSPTKNNHPTVKPIALMEYLINMVTPKGGTVLDCFAGSGSTLVAAKQNNFQYIGIEKEPEYVKIAEARIKAIPQKLL